VKELPTFDACLVHYQDEAAIRRSLVRMGAWSRQPGAVVIVDNSGDLSPGIAEEHRKLGFPVTVIDPGGNVGYAAAANLGIRAAAAGDTPYILLLTQDADLEPDAAELLERCLDEDVTVAVAAPVLGLASRPRVTFSAGGMLSRRARPKHLRQGASLGDPGEQAIRDVAWADGACLMVRVADAQSVKGLPEEYFLYVEEIDFQHALRLNGRRVVVVDRAHAYQEPGNFMLYLKYRNLLHFSRKYPAEFRPWPWPLALCRDLLSALRQGRPWEMAWAVRGVLDARRGRMGPPPGRIFGRGR
jgi:GT2 family glycosyltransferase